LPNDDEKGARWNPAAHPFPSGLTARQPTTEPAGAPRPRCPRAKKIARRVERLSETFAEILLYDIRRTTTLGGLSAVYVATPS